MDAFMYFMPTKVYFGENCVFNEKQAMSQLGKKALIITGRHSAKKNGSQEDVTKALLALEKEYIVFDEIEENPSIETVLKAANLAKKEKADFVIGIGGGSPMDSAKAAACLIANPDKGKELFFSQEQVNHVPVIEIPTTAGTGSETTPYAIMTDHEKRTKFGMSPKVFAAVSFLDAKYMDTLSVSVTNNTAVDALSHLIEGYLSTQSNFLSDKLSEIGMELFKECMPELKKRQYTPQMRQKIMLASTIAGFVISQAGTSLPHAMGYYLTYEKGIPHGRANGILTKAYLELFEDKTKINKIIEKLGMDSLDTLGAFLNDVLDTKEQFTEQELWYYAEEVSKNKRKMESFPGTLKKEDLFYTYKKSVILA